ncbi:MAG: GerMN domain-containing protein [Bacteroidales bacterium]|nr:GerMN domain-containing protein [Bacteroidales bacterium]
MKRKWMLLFLALCVLTAGLAGCGGRAPEKQGEYVLYFAAGSGEKHGPALRTENYTGSLSGEGGTVPTPAELVRALLAGPAAEDLRSPFPKGITMNRCEFDPDHPGHLKVSLSERYGELTDISLTLADYAIVLTLSQLENVESVEIISGGYAASYRSHQVLTASEAMLTDELAG